MINLEVVRGQIITVLYVVHPQHLSEKLLHSELVMLGVTVDRDTLVSEVAYLRDKKYVESEERKAPGKLRGRMWVHRLTARGKDLYEGNETDKTVTL